MLPQMLVICKARGMTLSSYIRRRIERESTRVHSNSCSKLLEWLEMKEEYKTQDWIAVHFPVINGVPVLFWDQMALVAMVPPLRKCVRNSFVT